MSNKRDLQIIEGGGVATAQGFHAGGVFAGIKTPGEDKYDLGLLVSDRDCAVAGTFSQNSVLSPSVTVSKEVVARGRARAVIANSGCANCAVGEQGLIDAQDAASIGAAELGVDADDVLVASTGVIGVELPMNLIRDHTPRIDVRGGDDAGLEFAKAIMTTDTHAEAYCGAVRGERWVDGYGWWMREGSGDDPPEHGDDAVFHLDGCGC